MSRFWRFLVVFAVISLYAGSWFNGFILDDHDAAIFYGLIGYVLMKEGL